MIVAEALQPGVNVSAVARKHGIKPSLLLRWGKLAKSDAKPEPGRRSCRSLRRRDLDFAGAAWLSAFRDRLAQSAKSLGTDFRWLMFVFEDAGEL